MMTTKNDKEPRIDWTDTIGVLCLYMGFLLFLVAFHVMAIDNDGDVSSVMNTVFIVYLTLYGAAVVFGFVGAIVHFLKWITWKATTPKWLQKEMKG